MLKLSISNIAWDASYDAVMYDKMNDLGYKGLEIAPTRLFQEQPYSHTNAASQWAHNLRQTYDLSISSMQSIWYGRTECLFRSPAEREVLKKYTKKAIDFASAIDCPNLVFGSPKNRNLIEGGNPDSAISFFRELGEYAAAHGTVLSLEANPAIYHTNYINTTKEAIEIAKIVNSPGIRVNLDLGTVICNKEDLHCLQADMHWIHHIHISEPHLNPIECRDIHQTLKNILCRGYYGYLSIEMGKGLEIDNIYKIMEQVKEIYYEV